MGRLQTWGAAARRSRLFQVVAVASWSSPLVGGRASCWPPAAPAAPAPPPTTAHRPAAVALGDSVPYGHGLANPYLTPQIGASRPAPSPRAPRRRPTPAWWPLTSASTMTVRPTNCHLIGDQLADQRRGGRRRRQHDPRRAVPASRPGRPATWPTRWRRRTWRSTRPAWSSLQDGADDIDFAPASSSSWPASSESASVSAHLRRQRVRDPARWPRSWRNVRTSLARAIERCRRTPGPWPCSTTTSRSPSRRRSPTTPRVSGSAPTWSAPASSPTRPAPPPPPRSSCGRSTSAIAGAVADARAAPRPQRHPGRRLGRRRRARHLHGRPVGLLRRADSPTRRSAADAEHIAGRQGLRRTPIALHGGTSCASLIAAAARAERRPARATCGVPRTRRRPGSVRSPRRGAAAPRRSVTTQRVTNQVCPTVPPSSVVAGVTWTTSPPASAKIRRVTASGSASRVMSGTHSKRR